MLRLLIPNCCYSNALYESLGGAALLSQHSNHNASPPIVAREAAWKDPMNACHHNPPTRSRDPLALNNPDVATPDGAGAEKLKLSNADLLEVAAAGFRFVDEVSEGVIL